MAKNQAKPAKTLTTKAKSAASDILRTKVASGKYWWQVTPFGQYVNFWKNYTNFKDKATRGDYWWYVLADFVLRLVIWIFTIVWVVLYPLASIIPNISIIQRRLNDAKFNTGLYWGVVAGGLVLGAIMIGIGFANGLGLAMHYKSYAMLGSGAIIPAGFGGLILVAVVIFHVIVMCQPSKK